MEPKKFIKNSIFESINENKDINNLTLYHGTNNKFNNFDLKFFNSGSGDGGWLGYGIYLTNDYEYAESYGDVLECEVKLNNPYILEDSIYSRRPEKLNNELGTNNSRETTNKLKQMGYDSVILKYKDEERTWLDNFIEVCVFNSSDIKIITRYKHGDESKEVNIKRGY